MNFISFLNKEDQNSYSLLKYLEESRGLSAPIFRIQENLAFSPFILKKTIKKLKEDLELFQLDTSFQLSELDFELKLAVDGKCSSRKLLGNYLRNSLSLKMILSLFKNDFKSVGDFGQKNFVSYSVAYNTLRNINDNGQIYGITAKRGKLFDSENRISSFLCSLFTLANIDFADVYRPEIIATTEQIVEGVHREYNLTRYERKKLFHYIAIKLQAGKISRVVDGGYDLFPSESLELVQDLLPAAYKEIDYHIISWLFVNNKVEIKGMTGDLGSDTAQLNQKFMEKFEQRYGTLEAELKHNLLQGLSRFHFNILYRSIHMFDPLELDADFFTQYWSEFYRFAAEYVQNTICEYPELLKFEQFLAFHYTMIMIDNVPFDRLIKPVKVFIDFSYGDRYNRFVADNLTTFIKINTIAVDSIEQADLILTNVNDLYPDTDLDVVVWLDLPRSIDWMMLLEHLIRIQEEILKDVK